MPLRLPMPPKDLWLSTLWQDLLMVSVVSLAFALWLPSWLLRRRVANRRRGRGRTEPRQTRQPRPRATSAPTCGAQVLPAAAGHTQARRESMDKLERMLKTYDNLAIALERIAEQRCTCTSCMARKHARAADQGHSQARLRSAASSLRCPPEPASPALTLERSQNHEALDSELRNGAKRHSRAARSGASPDATPIKAPRRRFSSGVLFYTHVVQAQIKRYATPEERPAPRPAAASGPQSPTKVKRRQFSRLPESESLDKRHPSSGGHRRSVAEAKIPVTRLRLHAAPGPQSPALAKRWHSTGDLRYLALQNLVARGDI